jgi:NAD(P)-dependent dehydrogenase (short-subunit alcohol dehydrogenase family)
MPESSVFVVTGARQFSLGAELIDRLAKLAPLSTILAIDIEPLPPPAENVLVRRFNLNPFDDQRGFEAWSVELHEMFHSLVLTGGSRPVRGLFLGAAKYQVGRYECSTADERAAVLGCNVAGKWEVLHAAMRLNADLGFDNGQELDIFDVGSLHGVRHSSHRALYNPSKAAGLELCRVLLNGSEVRRAVHLAPGPVDTPMLHWNHWVLKEHGDPEFLTLVKDRCPSLYRSIFRDGDWAALAAAQHELELEHETVQNVFGRYVRRRAALAQTEEGITSPEVFAEYIANQMLGARTGESGIVEISSPRGQFRVSNRAF